MAAASEGSSAAAGTASATATAATAAASTVLGEARHRNNHETSDDHAGQCLGPDRLPKHFSKISSYSFRKRVAFNYIDAAPKPIYSWPRFVYFCLRYAPLVLLFMTRKIAFRIGDFTDGGCSA